jgi:hypothetical protein
MASAQKIYTGKAPGMINAKYVTGVVYSLSVRDAKLYGTQAVYTQHPLSPSDDKTPSYEANNAGPN